MEIFKIIKIRGGKKETVEDCVVREIPLTVIIGTEELATLLCTPEDLEDLVTGFLFTSAVIRKAEDIKSIAIDHQQWTAYVDLVNPGITRELVFKRLFTSGCGRGILFYNAADIINRVKIASDFKIAAGQLGALMADFQKKSESYLKTGGTHSAALGDESGILIFKEDIGRHNAIDKVIGCGLRNGGFGNKVLISSGRISSEVLLKAQKAVLAVIISQSAPTNQAVKLARDMDITLIGFARGDRMNIYSKEERVVYGA